MGSSLFRYFGARLLQECAGAGELGIFEQVCLLAVGLQHVLHHSCWVAALSDERYVETVVGILNPKIHRTIHDLVWKCPVAT